MPLPRFHRLPFDRREEILRVARDHFARNGPHTASYNQIIAAAGISKTAAYQYFDGRDDLLVAVLTDVRARLGARLGPWVEADTADDFWARLRAGAARLREHLVDHPDDLALTGAVGGAGPVEEPGAQWLASVLANGRSLGVVRTDVDDDLMLAATAAVFQAADACVLDALRRQAGASLEDQAWELIAALWSPPRRGEEGRD